jgi:para-nitrobenzyl esterase
MQPKPSPFFVWSEEYLIPTEPISEDCLYLNIWTSHQSPQKKKPVLVWIYGGGFSSGGSACPIYDGEAFAREDVVFVSINYRVGIFGFFAHSEINKENDGLGSGNFGLLDQIAGLEWVKNNIANFGGDPNNVTIAGQSAGSMSVNCLVASPLAKGLFNKAIGQSGSNFTRGNFNKAQAIDASNKYALSYGKLSLSEMRNIPAEELLKKPIGMRGPYIDGIVLPNHILDIFLQGKENKVTLLTGWNQDEGLSMGAPKGMTAYTDDIKKQYKENGDKLLAFYPGNTNEEAFVSQKNLSRDLVFGMQNFVWSNMTVENGATAFVYRFKRLVPENSDATKYSAFHTGEVPYAYNNLKFVNRPFKQIDYELARRMSSYWINFIKTGNPNGKGLPIWPNYSKDGQSIMIFDDESKAGKLTDADALAFLQLVTKNSQQKLLFGKQVFELHNVTGSIIKLENEEVMKIERDLKALPFDENNLEATVDQPTFAKLVDTDIKNGIIEVKVMSKIMENSPFKEARGFIGIGFRIDSKNHFEGIYLRPANGRAEDQLRRNHAVQYFAYPGYTFSKLRKEANGIYETYADIGLNEWIDIKIEFRDKKAMLYINNQQYPSFIVNKMLGNTISGSIGLWVEVGTVGYFKDLKVRSLE